MPIDADLAALGDALDETYGMQRFSLGVSHHRYAAAAPAGRPIFSYDLPFLNVAGPLATQQAPRKASGFPPGRQGA